MRINTGDILIKLKSCLSNKGYKIDSSKLVKPKNMQVVTGFLPLDFIEKKEEDRVSAVHNYKDNLSKAGGYSAKHSNNKPERRKRVKFELTAN